MTIWVEVRPSALAANARAVQSLLPPGGKLCAVVKANGYGHGAVAAARAFLAADAAMLAVTTVNEALELRAAGLRAEILLLGSHAPDECDTVVTDHLTATISDEAAAERLAQAARQRGRPAPVHLLLDTGMGRDGLLPAALGATWPRLVANEWLRVAGVYTHFPNSIARDKEPTRRQLARFVELVGQLDPRPPIVHAANSGATLDVPESRLDMVRVGTLLYGQYPSTHVGRLLDLQETWGLRARLVEVRRLPAGWTIGYGSECRLWRSRLVGTLLVGWQHGFTLQPSSLTRGVRGLRALVCGETPSVTVRGVRCPVLGRIGMQSCCVDVTEVPGVQVGDVASIPCRRVTTDRGIPRVALD
jgi:alanine racemase